MTAAKVRIRRSGGIFRRASRVRGVALLCLLGLATSCVMPLAASRTSPGLTIALDAPKPYDPSLTLLDFLPAQGPTAAEQAMMGMTTGGEGEQGGTPGFSPTMLVPGPAASPYVFRGRNAQDLLRASLCLTAAIYYEAGNEPEEGQRAVAQVVLNRVRHPAYPNTVCGVVYQGTERNDTLCQFTFGCDGSMARIPVASSWARARRVAQAALAGSVYAPVGLSTNYHTLAVNPVWNRALTPTAIVGAHIFFRWPGGAGMPQAFHAAYRGNEPVPAPKPKLPLPNAPTDLAALIAANGAMPAASDTAPAQDWSAIAQSMPVSKDQRVAAVVPATPVSADRRYVAGALPESDIKEEYRSSGQWIAR